LLDQFSVIPLYLQIRDVLRSEILERLYQDGDTFFSESDLAVRFGVARGTVRQALASLEQDGYIRREKGRGTFVSRKEITVDRSKTTTISFIVPHCRDSFVPTMLLGVEAAARERGAHILFRHIESNLALQSQALEESRAYGAVGVLLFPVDATYRDPALLKLLAEGFPVVLVDHYIPGVDVDYVVSDGYGGMLMAVQHLLGFGHKRIGFVTWDVQTSGEVGRFLGYQQGLREWGIDPSPDLFCQLEEYPVEDLSPLVELLSGSKRPTAIVALNDYLAIKVIKVCRGLNLRIPQDIALIGFDNTDIAAQLEVPLTTVSQPIHEIGAQAVRFLLNKITGLSQGPQHLILPTNLIIRESSGKTLILPE
jgi:GntR family transcriptional regulator, arabinose operon transcriptional repressor